MKTEIRHIILRRKVLWSLVDNYVLNQKVGFRDFDISVKCENYCTQLFLECLSGCDDDNCYGECHRNDYVCVDSKKNFNRIITRL